MNPLNILQPSISIAPYDIGTYYYIYQEIRIVSALSTTSLPPYVIEIVGDQVSLTASNLKGNTHKKYKIEICLVNGLNADSWCMRFNGVSANVYDQQQTQFVANAVSAGTTFTAATLFSIGPIAQTSVTNIVLDLNASTGANRTWICNQYGTQSNQQVSNPTVITGGSFRDSTTDLTSILFTSNGGNMRYSVGTIIRIMALCR